MLKLSDARARLDAASSTREEMAALTDLSAALYEFDAVEAVQVAEKAMALAEQIDDPVGRAHAAHNRGWAFSSMGVVDQALRDQLAAYTVFIEHGDTGGAANALLAIGDIHGEAGEFASALEYFERASALMDAIGDEVGRGVVLNLSAIVLSNQKRHREALDLFQRAERIFDRHNDALRLLTARINRGFEIVALTRLEPAGAEVFLEQAGDVSRWIIEQGRALGEDGRNTLAYGHALSAQILAARGDRVLALDHARTAVELADAGGFDQVVIQSSLDSAGWLIEDGDHASAAAILDYIGARAEARENRPALARVLRMRADMLEDQADLAGSLSAFRAFYELEQNLHNAENERRGRLTSVRVEIEEAHRQVESARERVAELEAMDRDKREFLASVSHELRTPLTGIVGFASELAENWETFDEVEAHDMVKVIARQSIDMAAIVDDLLTITRLQAGSLNVYPGDIELSEHLNEMARTLGRQLDRSVPISGRAWAFADAARVRQIVRNLVTNAIRHGGSEMRVQIGETESTVVVEVRDSGAPIAPDRVARMFEPFEHSDDAVRTPHSVGLGLTVARSLALFMDGDLEYFHDGESVFRLSLPRSFLAVSV